MIFFFFSKQACKNNKKKHTEGKKRNSKNGIEMSMK